MKTIGDIGERALIARLARRMPAARGVAVGIGDDCAVVRIDGSSRDALFTTDAVIEGRHFRANTPPAKIGRKAIGRVLSDIAAMGGAARLILINLVATPTTRLARVDKIYRAATQLARQHGASIIGGDTTTGRVLELHVFGVGVVPRGKAVLRSGARPGDVIYVTGELGGSIHGKHLDFAPRLREGQWLRKWATSMIDISDGLATDLGHICARSGVGADLDAMRIPLSRHANGIRAALTDGEDFELLFTVSEKNTRAFERARRRSFRLRCTAIGAITRGRALTLNGRPLRLSGFEHFR